MAEGSEGRSTGEDDPRAGTQRDGCPDVIVCKDGYIIIFLLKVKSLSCHVNSFAEVQYAGRVMTLAWTLEFVDG